MTNDLVKEDDECLESVFLALQWLDRSADCAIPRPHPPRRALEKDVIVVTVCGRESPPFHTNFYLPSTEQWYRLPSISCEPTHVFSHRGKVFVVTKDIVRSQCYDPDLNRWFPAPWTKLNSILAFMTLDYTSLQIHDVLVIKEEICFIVAERLSLALWRYNVDLNSMTPLFHWVKIASFCTVVVDKLIYVIGGRMLNDDSYSDSGIEIYSKNAPHSHSSTFDTDGHEWKEIAPLNEARMDAFGVNKNDEQIFIAGGLGGIHVWLNSCEVYNIATNEWQFIASLTVPRSGGKRVLINETIFVLGGEPPKPFKGSCFFRSVRCL